jgi:hypothetical protein
MTQTLDSIIGLLAKNRQRATYGAVAELTGTSPRVLMNGRPKNHLNSWVVAEKNGQPTKYAPEQIDPTLIVRMGILNSRTALEEWLVARTAAAAEAAK